MLQSFRKYTQGWVATLLATLLSLAFVMWGIENYIRGGHKKNLAAKVNGVEISSDTINSDFQRLLLRAKQTNGLTLPSNLQQQLKVQILNDLIARTVLIEAANKAGFMISPLQTVTIVKEMPQFQVDGVFSKDRFEQIIARLNYTRDGFFNDINQSLILNQVASGIQGSSFMLPGDVNQLVSLEEQKRDVQYAIIPSSHFKTTISSDKIADYYNQHQAEFNTPEKVQLEFLELNVQKLKQTMKVSEQEAEQEFVSASDKLTELTYTNSNSLTEAANALGLNVQHTETFSREGGQSSLTKNPKILNTVFSPDFIKSNLNSNLIELSPGSVVVVRIKEYQPSAPLPLETVKDKIAHKLGLEAAQQLARQKGEQLMAKINSNGDFRKILSAAGYQVNDLHDISRKQTNVDKQLLQLAFSLSPVAPKAFSGSTLNNGDYALVVLNKATDYPINKVTETQRTNMTKLYSNVYGKAEYETYAANQISKAKIKVYPTKP